MALASGDVCFRFSSLICLLTCMVPSVILVPLFRPHDILNATSSFCVILFPEEALTKQVQELVSTLVDVSFVNETGVLFGRVQDVPWKWPNGRSLKTVGGSVLKNSVLLFKKVKKDRTCLLMPEDNAIATPTVETYELPITESEDVIDTMTLTYALGHIIEFINGNCATFRTKDGSLNLAGIHRKDILDNMFTTSLQQDHIRLKQCFESKGMMQTNEFCVQNVATGSYDAAKMYVQNDILESKSIQECERIEMPTDSQFVHEYVSRSKPVIITGAIKEWPALQKWSNQYLREMYGSKKVHIKITPDGQYEGVEPITAWEDHVNFNIPKSVYEKLPYPDIVVVRPASMEIEFSEFLDLVENISSGKVKNSSAYLEYSSITDYFPDLRKDIEEMQFFRNSLHLKHVNIWLSDGHTLGKLHFDPFDNFLCQISGEKQVTMFEPHDNTRLYEGHIQEAMLTYNTTEKMFYRRKLLDSTSMVMSPVDLVKQDLRRYPKFVDVHPLNCTIGAGDVLFMPSFWWHEVQSRPGVSDHRNLAVNFWYEPFLTREFPCPECKLDVNAKYFHLL